MPRQVDGRGALGGFRVQCRAGFDVVCHIGNRHDQAPALLTAQRLREYRVIKVFGGRAIDRNQGHFRQIMPVSMLLGLHLARQPRGSPSDRLGPFPRNL